MKKTTMKKVVSIATISMLAACMLAPTAMNAFAAATPSTYSITINANGNVDPASHTFEAYQIFGGDYSGGVLSNIVWGANMPADGAGVVSALQADATLNAVTEIAALSETSTAEDVAEALSKITDDSAAAKALARVLSTIVTGTATTNAANSNTIELENAGYYFVKDAADSGTASGDARTAFILEVVGEAEVNIKTDAPTLVKKIWHNDTTAEPTIDVAAPTGAGWGDVGDNQIGDTVYYYTETSVPDMSDYDTYRYIIRDSMSAGLTFGEVTDIVYVPATGGTAVSLNGKYTLTADDDATTADFTETFYITFTDLKAALNGLGNDGYIYTYYTATLNENALVSDIANTSQHNDNTAYLEYSNNPNVSGSGDSDNETGTTPEDTVYDWTFTFGAEKVDGDNQPLAGAGFTLYNGESAVNLVAISDVSQANITAAADTLYYRVATAGDADTVTEMLTTETANKFVILGLDDTISYTLKETTTPSGYNDCADKEVTISSGYNTVGDQLTALTNNSTTNLLTIVNKQGSSLPSTGGIGTKVFYVIGGTLVAGAGVALIVKKRMKNDEE